MDIVIIGAGASAALCAIEASKNKNNKITIIESNAKVLKKLLISGNGKCNFTNLNFKDQSVINENDILKYYNNSFYLQSFKHFSNIDLIEYFYNLGMPISIFDKYDQKYVYPITKNSRTLYYLLLDNLNKDNIKINTNETVLSFNKENENFSIITDKEKYNADVLVISAGGKAYYDKDNQSNIFNSLEKLNIKINNSLPALSPLIIDKQIFGKDAKFRFEANVSLYIDDKIISQEFGEIQINNNTISGIPILNLSSKAILALYKKEKVVININFLYNFLYNKYNKEKIDINFDKYINDEMLRYFDYQKNNNVNISIKQLLSYILDTTLIDIVLDKNKINNEPVSNISKDNIIKLIDSILNFKLDIISYADFKSAQLMQGGIDTTEINDNSYESNKIKNLYFTGEIIDVNGICGGYNLQFAFGSGYTVGKTLYDKN